MKAFLMHGDRDFELGIALPVNAAELAQDLELDILFDAMAAGDSFLREVASNAVLASLHEPTAILYRQQVLADCLELSNVVRGIYSIVVEAIEREKKIWSLMSDRYPEATLHRSTEALQIFVAPLRRLRQVADENGSRFHSAGFQRFFAMIATELDDEYLRTVEEHLQQLEFRNGMLISAELGDAAKGANYVLRKSPETKHTWTDRVQSWMSRVAGRSDAGLAYEVDDRDEAGFRALSDLRVHGIRRVATALAQSTDHVLSFFKMLRLELGFYIGCLNLRDQLVKMQEPLCLPEPLPAERRVFTCRYLYDVSLSLSMAGRTVGNDVDATDKALVMISGANRGGKSTFLRSVGLAQLMMQCGMFVPAESFCGKVCRGIYTHFKREEDATMRSGKLDEELARMSALVDKIVPGSIVLLNESFASTNEREGSEIARQIVRAMFEMGVKVFYLTHMFDLAYGFHLATMDTALFLRAERLAGGRRTFRLLEGKPLPTSYGEDLYQRIFGADSRVPAGE